MIFSPLTSRQVLDFLPLNTWTEVHLLPSDFKNVYIVTTKDKMEKRINDMQSIALYSSFYEKVTQFKLFELVAVEIEGKWFRGKLIGFNEFQTDNIRVVLIDYGSVYQTKFENLYVLPYYFMYEPLALPITFKELIPDKTIFSIKPLLSESNLHEGTVLVDVNCDYTKLENGVNEKQLIESKKNINSDNDSKITCVQNMTKGHDNNELSLHEEKLNNVPLKNGDYCILTYFKDFTCLYVSKVKLSDDGSYKYFDFDSVYNTCRSTDKSRKYDPDVGDMVKVFSPENCDLFRAKILKNNNGSYDVFYIDFGNIETVPSKFIYELADDLKKPGIAVKIGLSDLKNIQTTDQMENMFFTFCNDGKLFMIEFDEKSKNCLENVKLKDVDNGSYIDSKYITKCSSLQFETVHSDEIFELSDELKKEENKQNIDRSESIILKELKSGNSVNTEVLKLLPTEKIPIINCKNSTATQFEDVKCTYVAKDHDLENVKIIKETVASSTAENVQLKIEEHKEPTDAIDNKLKFEPLKNREVVQIRYFVDSTSVFVSRSSDKHLKLFNYIITRTAEDKSKRKKINIEIGDIVRAMYYDVMYRAKIIKKVDQNHFFISFIDFGNDETVHADEIFELPEELKKIPGLCVRIGIKGSNDLVMKYLEELDDQFLIIEYDEGNPNGLKEANLKKINSCNVFDEL